ncbi:hypothetical protein PUATCC27989T_00447 [Phytobacter ursingii]|nr:hypothetical protein PUATCC27989T_00447 [Phytobacter ursingii]
MTHKFEIWLDSGANHTSCNKQTLTLDDIGLSEEEWDSMDEEERDLNMRDIAFETLEWGWKEVT